MEIKKTRTRWQEITGKQFGKDPRTRFQTRNVDTGQNDTKIRPSQHRVEVIRSYETRHR